MSLSQLKQFLVQRNLSEKTDKQQVAAKYHYKAGGRFTRSQNKTGRFTQSQRWRVIK